MAKRRRPKHVRRGDARLRHPRHHAPSTPRTHPDTSDVPFIPELRLALRRDGIDVLLQVCLMIETALASQPGTPEATVGEDVDAALAALTDSFVEVDIAETTAALHVIAAFTSDESLRERIDAVVRGRRQPMPALIGDLESTRVRRAVTLNLSDGDGTDYVIEVDWPDGVRRCAALTLSGDSGMVDAYLATMGLDEFVSTIRNNPRTAATVVTPVPLSRARRFMSAGLRHLALSEPAPTLADNPLWPAVRHLLAWLTARLPANLEAESLSDTESLDATADPRDLVEAFLSSPQAEDLSREPDGRDAQIAADIFRFATDTGDHDPLRWNAKRIENLLVDWMHEQPDRDLAYRERVPHVLRQVITYCGERLDTGPAERTRLLGTIAELEPVYGKLAETTVKLHENQRIIESFGTGDGLFEAYVLRSLATSVGGEDVLDALDTTALPEEPLDLDAVSADIRDDVQRIAGLVDAAVLDDFGIEGRTACRRLLSAVAAGDPAIFRRGSNERTTAAAIAWLAGRANRLIGEPHTPPAAEILRRFGVKDVRQRAETMQRAIGVKASRTDTRPVLADPRFLVASQRRAIIDERDRYRRALAASERANADEDPEG